MTPMNRDHVSVKEAAEILGISTKRIYMYIYMQRLPGIRVGSTYMLPREAVEQLKISRVRHSARGGASWSGYRHRNILSATQIQVQVRPGQQEQLRRILLMMREADLHALSGTVERYILEGDAALNTLIILMIWKVIEMPDETTRARELDALKLELADVVDWETAVEKSNRILIHTYRENQK